MIINSEVLCKIVNYVKKKKKPAHFVEVFNRRFFSLLFIVRELSQ